MTQTIKQLKQVAGIDYNPDQEGLDLFAKLLVEYCATFINEYADRNGNDLLEHFGLDK